MGSASPVVDLADLNQFSPLDQLAPTQVERLLEHSRVERLPPGKRLFGIGESDGRALFLLTGQIALVSADNRIRMLKAATPEAVQAIADHRPRESTALARTTATVLCVDAGLLASLLHPVEAEEPTPDRVPAGDDPVNAELDLGPIFASPLFTRLPAPHLQVLMQRMSVIEVRAGEVVIREGDDSAAYHVIESGRFRVTRRRRRRGQNDGPTELGRLEGFGEATLIANEAYDCTVTALKDGRLLRFSKGEFLTLIVRPFIKWIGHNELAPLMLKDSALIDVRSHKAYARHHLRNSINLPMQVLRQIAAILDRNRNYIVCCDNVRRSAAAAFLLAQQGMEAMILNETVRNARSGARHGPDNPPTGNDQAPV